DRDSSLLQGVVHDRLARAGGLHLVPVSAERQRELEHVLRHAAVLRLERHQDARHGAIVRGTPTAPGATIPTPDGPWRDRARAGARTYSQLLGSPNIAKRVAKQISGTARRGIESAISVSPVPETQLIKITAEDRRPKRAMAIANAYASEFIAYSATRLSPET